MAAYRGETDILKGRVPGKRGVPKLWNAGLPDPTRSAPVAEERGSLICRFTTVSATIIEI